MITKGKQQNKITRHIVARFKILGKARGLYKKVMFDCAGRIDKNSIVSCTTPHHQAHQLPKHLSAIDSSKENNNDKDYQEPPEMTISTTNNNHEKMQLDVAHNIGTSQFKSLSTEEPQEYWKHLTIDATNGVMRSYSIGVGRIGRIDEDKPCDFKEVDVNRFLYPRCTTYVFANRKVVY